MGAPTADELALARTESGQSGSDAELPPVGATIGRFVVERMLGEGGMGVVLSARDPELRRSVALKLVRVSEGSADAGEARERLLREARAMAKLRHPNVLTIYEAGTHGEQVYVAMEQVAGGTLTRRLAERDDPDWRDVVRWFAAAGSGLAAAHDAGLVHRDFKPDNVLVDGDRVLVADFGLVGTDVAAADAADANGDSAEILGERLTRAGAVVGTPRYMAPEQHTAGEPVDARTDQFSFCVALYEALYGKLPFRGRTRGAYLRAISADAVRSPPPDTDVPPWIHTALLRGLRSDPEARFPSMRELLAEITVDPDLERLGERQRAIGLGVVSFSVVAWAVGSMFIDYELTYARMAAIDAFVLALVLGATALMRRQLSVPFNRKVFLIGATAVAITLLMVGAGAYSGVDPAVTARQHLFVTLCFGTAAAILLDRWLWIVAAGYCAGYVSVSVWPGLFYPASALSHGLMAVVIIAVLGRRNRGVAPPR